MYMPDLTVEQQEAVDVIKEWFHDSSKSYNAVGGFAGCILPNVRIKVRKKSNSNVHKIKLIHPNPAKPPKQ